MGQSITVQSLISLGWPQVQFRHFLRMAFTGVSYSFNCSDIFQAKRLLWYTYHRVCSPWVFQPKSLFWENFQISQNILHYPSMKAIDGFYFQTELLSLRALLLLDTYVISLLVSYFWIIHKYDKMWITKFGDITELYVLGNFRQVDENVEETTFRSGNLFLLYILRINQGHF